MANSDVKVTVDGEDAEPDQTKMEIVHLADRGGHSIKLQVVDGKYYIPYYLPEILRDKVTMEMRVDDVYIAAFLRTGTHWVFEMVSMLLNGTPETVRKSKGQHQLENNSAHKLGGLPSPRVLNTHLMLSDGPRQMGEKRCRVIYNLRDPKDVIVSLYNFYISFPSIIGYHGTFEDFLFLFLKGKVDCNGMFAHLRDAEAFIEEHPHIPVHFHTYEHTMKDPLVGVQRLSDFLHLPRDDNLCTAIVEKCQFPNMVKDKFDYTVQVDGKAPLFRKGIVGDWRNYFTEEMLEDYYRVYEEKMAGSRFFHLYSRDKYV